MKNDENIENVVIEKDFKKSVLKLLDENDSVYSSEEEKDRPKIVKVSKCKQINKVKNE